MKLLFDENLSPKLPHLLATLWPGSAHVRECGLLGRTDEDVWEFARAKGFIIVSKDSDFQQRSLLYGLLPSSSGCVSATALGNNLFRSSRPTSRTFTP